MGFSSGIGSSDARKTYRVDSLGAVFNVPLQTHIVGRSLGHHITIQYGGSTYPCGRDDASIRSVHTIDSDDDEHEHVASPRSGISRETRGSYTSLLSPLKRAVDSQRCLKAKDKEQSKKYRSWLPSWGKTTTKTKPAQPRQGPLPGISKRLSLYQPLQNKKRSDNKLKRRSGPVSNSQQAPQLQTQPTKPVFPQQSCFYPSSTIYAPQGYLPYSLNYYVPQCAQVQPNTACLSTAQHPSPNDSADAKETPAIANRIQTVQQTIDLAKSKLEQDRGNLLLQNELAQLKSRLNHILDSAVKRSTPLNHEDGLPKLREDEPRATIQSTTHQPAERNLAADTGSHEEHSLKQPDQSVTSFHTCSNCDAVRSKSFHSRHPYTPGQKPVHNLCKSCRASGKSVSVLKRYHFCSSCGIVRSKEYQRSHTHLDPVLVARNFCSKCAKTSRSARRISREPPQECFNSKLELQPDADPTLPKARDLPDLPTPQTVHKTTSPAVDLPLASPYLPNRRIGSAQRRAERAEPEREQLSKSLNLDGSPSMRQYQPPSAETISPTSENSAMAQKGTPENKYSPVEDLRRLPREEQLTKSVAQKSPLISPPHPETTQATQPFETKTDSNESQSRPGSNHSDDSFKSSSGVFHKRSGPTTQHWPPLNHTSKADNQAHPTTQHRDASSTFPDDSSQTQPQPSQYGEQPRFSKGAFDKLSSTLPQSSPWLNPNSPKRSTYTTTSSSSSADNLKPTSCYYTRPPQNKNNNNNPYLNQTSIFESYATSSTDANTGIGTGTRMSNGFESTRGAWSNNTRRGHQERVPEPIIEEPASPVLSAVRTPLLLEFDVSDLSESADSSDINLAQHDEFTQW